MSVLSDCFADYIITDESNDSLVSSARISTTIDEKLISHKDRSYKKKDRTPDISVTDFVKDMFRIFDFQKWAGNVAKFKKVSIDEATKSISEGRLDSAVFGTNVHKIASDGFLGKRASKVAQNDRETVVYSYIYIYAKKLAEQYDDVYSELSIQSDTLNIGGRVDALVKDFKGNWRIIDFKTDKQINLIEWSKLSKDERYKASNIKNNNFYQYAFQLNLYEWILKENGTIPHDAKVKKELHWVKYNENDLKNMISIQVIQCPELHRIVSAMIKQAKEEGVIEER